MGRGQGWRDGRDGGDTALRALRKYGVDSQFLYKRPKTVFWTVPVAITIALPGLVATAMTLQHMDMDMDLIAMQFCRG